MLYGLNCLFYGLNCLSIVYPTDLIVCPFSKYTSVAQSLFLQMSEPLPIGAPPPSPSDMEEVFPARPLVPYRPPTDVSPQPLALPDKDSESSTAMVWDTPSVVLMFEP